MSERTPPLARIGRYELVKRLGAGGMGEVFLARVSGTAGFEKQVVIKKILPHLADNPTFVQRFIDEGKLVVRLRHAAIAQILDMGEEASITYMAMEYVEGRDLKDLLQICLREKVEFPLSIKVAILVAVLEALDYAHHCSDDEGNPLGIIHRDVSPSNVMVSRSGEIKLVDFGIARATDRLSTSVSGALHGKFSYMSPQQAAGGELDARSDLFSVGVMGWELLTGKRPFDGTTDLETLDFIRHRPADTLKDHLPELPSEVSESIERMLEKSPEDRFESAGEAARSLQAFFFRTESLVSAREVAAWMEAVLGRLPESIREAPSAALSLDDALRLPLDSGQGAVAPSATESRMEPPHTVSVIHQPDTNQPLGTPEGALSSQSQSANLATPSSVPITGELLTASEGRRGRLVEILVLLNLLLLGAVGLLVWQFSDQGVLEKRGQSEEFQERLTQVVPTEETSAPSGAGAQFSGNSLKEQEAKITEPGQRAKTTLDAEESAEKTGAETGNVLGGLLKDKLPSSQQEADTVTLRVKATPDSAQIKVSGHGSYRGKAELELPQGQSVTVTAQAQGYQSRTTRLIMKQTESIHLNLKPARKGRMAVRYFPAAARVLIDGRAIPSRGSNVLNIELGEGKHQLQILSPSGQSRQVHFSIEAGETTNLATIKAE